MSLSSSKKEILTIIKPPEQYENYHTINEILDTDYSKEGLWFSTKRDLYQKSADPLFTKERRKNFSA